MTYFLKTQGQHLCISELPLLFNGFTYFLKTQSQDICISESPLLSFNGFTYKLNICISKLPMFSVAMGSLTSWGHKGSIFVLVNDHCHLMDLVTCWMTQSQYIQIVELTLSCDGFTYILRTQGQYICTGELTFSFEWIYLLSKDTRVSHWYSELLLSFDGFTYHLKTQGMILWLEFSGLELSLNSVTCWRHKQCISISEVPLSFDGIHLLAENKRKAYLY